MTEYINIISKEAITAVPTWLQLVCGIISIGGVLSTFVYWAIVKDPEKAIKWLFVAGGSALAFMMAFLLITKMFFAVPTGQYKYEATVNKDKITVAQYEKFIEQYHPTIVDGVYYFDGGPLYE